MELEKLVLSAILHDIGKFAQRAKRPLSKQLESDYLPVRNGRSSHWHALYSDYFIEKDLPLPEKLEGFRPDIARTASIHHNPVEDNLADMCVCIADRLSSGLDRIKKEDIESSAGFRESRLVSVFDEIELMNHQFRPPGNYYYRLAPLDAQKDIIFPVKGEPKGEAAEYQPLFDQFLEALNKLDLGNSFRNYLDNLTAVLEQFTWAIPSSSYHTLSDIPLFDHSLGTAGIAQALYLYHQEKKTVPTDKDYDEKFILLSGDLSGIQNYIFGVSHSNSKGASKIFRARSFYIQAVVQSVILEIEKNLNLYPVCRLINSGGKFTLLLPNNESLNQYLDEIDYEVQIWFRKKFKGLLTLPLSWTTRLSQADLNMSHFSKKMDEANESLDAAKLKKLHKTFASLGSVIENDYKEFDGGNCSYCGKNAADKNPTEKYGSDEDEQLPICRDCNDQIHYIGRLLPKSKHIVYDSQGRIPLFGSICLSFTDNYKKMEQNTAFRIEALAEDMACCRAGVARHLPLTAENQEDQGIPGPWGDHLDEIQPKTFEMIADVSKKKLPDGTTVGRPLLGFLKADVDNLGLIFSLGLGNKMSLARFASLSRMMNLFFSDYLVAFLEKEFPDIYVVFAGGDDLFLIGPWHQTLTFASAMRKKFSKFCAMNPDITLSCGILPARPRLPVRSAADHTEKYLEEAKHNESNNRIKDLVSFLGKVLPWDQLENLLETGKIFDKALEEKDRTLFSSAFLYRLLTYHKMYRDFTDNGNIKAGRYLSHAHYDIARNIRKEGDAQNKKELDLLYEIFSVGSINTELLEALDIPIFYALNLNRIN